MSSIWCAVFVIGALLGGVCADEHNHVVSVNSSLGWKSPKEENRRVNKDEGEKRGFLKVEMLMFLMIWSVSEISWEINYEFKEC